MGSLQETSTGNFLVSFTVDTNYDDLPSDVIYEAKLLILDSVGCGVAGTRVRPGKIAIDLAQRLGGPQESSIWGTSFKISSVNAAFANGQLVNALDYDALLAGGHTPPYVVPSVMAVAEARGSSGKMLILAASLAFEISARIGLALQQASPIGDEPFRWPDRQGYAYCNIGVAAGVGRLLNLDEKRMAHALGIASHLSQVLTWVRFSFSEPRPMTKYGVPGWQNTGGLIATFLAEIGYEGDTSFLDSDTQGFWKFCGYAKWNPQKVIENLGRSWFFKRVNYKPYPCCRVLHPAIECLQLIMDRNNLKPHEIESIVCYLPKTVEAPVFQNRELNNIVDIQFGLPYVLAIVAHKIKSGPEWQDMIKVKEPKILSFSKRVTLEVHPLTEKEPRLTTVEVRARGKIFREDRIVSHGSLDSPMSTDEIVDKFRENTKGILTKYKIDKAVDLLLNLESVADVREVMAQVSF